MSDAKTKRAMTAMRGALALLASMAFATPAMAVTLGYELTVNDPIYNSANGNLNVPDFQLTNTSQTGAQITNFELSIGNTAFNYDFVRIQNAFVDPGNDLSFSLNSVGTTNDGVGDDTLLYSFLGFDPGDVFRFEVDVDPDTGGPVADYRTALFPTATALVTFEDGSVLSTDFSSADPNSTSLTLAESVIAPVPLPGGLPLMGIAGLIGFVVLRKRPAKGAAIA